MPNAVVDRREECKRNSEGQYEVRLVNQEGKYLFNLTKCSSLQRPRAKPHVCIHEHNTAVLAWAAEKGFIDADTSHDVDIPWDKWIQDADFRRVVDETLANYAKKEKAAALASRTCSSLSMLQFHAIAAIVGASSPPNSPTVATISKQATTRLHACRLIPTLAPATTPAMPPLTPCFLAAVRPAAGRPPGVRAADLALVQGAAGASLPRAQDTPS